MAGAGSNLDEADTTTTMPNLPALTNGTAGETQENESYEDDIAALLASAHIDDVCYDFNGMFGYVRYTTSYFDDGHRRIIWDFHVTSESASVFHVEVDEDGCSFVMTKRISPYLLDIMGRYTLELSQRHPDTHTIAAAMRETSDQLVADVGTDFENVYSDPQVHLLEFPCKRKFHKQLLWHQGDEQLYIKRSRDRSVSEDAVHQLTPILRLTFVGSEDQRMRAIDDEDVNINSPPRPSMMGRGAPPPPPPQPHSLKSPPFGKRIARGNSGGSDGGSSGMGGSGLKSPWGGSNNKVATYASLVPADAAEEHRRQNRIRERSGRLKRDEMVEDASDSD